MNPSASCSSTENSAENSPSRSSHDRATMTQPLYPCLLFMTDAPCAAIIALRGAGDGDVGVSGFPEREEVLISGAGFGGVALESDICFNSPPTVHHRIGFTSILPRGRGPRECDGSHTRMTCHP